MDRETVELREFYEREASLRKRGPVGGRRAELRRRFLATLRTEGRSSIVDLGAGPGLDGTTFTAAGHSYVGIDLAFGNAVLASEVQIRIVQASIRALPIRSRSFEAGWSASTLMHLPSESASTALAEMVRVLRPGSPLWVGLWGSEDERSVTLRDETAECCRPFHLRCLERNRQLFANYTIVEDEDRWENAAPGEDYQIFRLRIED